MRAGALTLIAVLSLGGPVAVLAQDVPLPTASPAEPPAEGTSDPTLAGQPAPAGLPEAGPLPETRPEPEVQPASEPAAPGAATAAPATVPGSATPGAPQPAYVPPEKARTVPEPSAPETPDSDVTPAEAVEAAVAIEDARVCEAELRARGAEFEVEPTISEGDCGVLRPVALAKLSNGVTLPGKTQVLCRTALALDIWMTDGVAPAAAKELGDRRVTALRDISTYQCRARASETRISEHSRGSAIDIGGFTLSDGPAIMSEEQAPGTAEDRFLADVRRAACGPFRTVLGPGTDSDHGTHLHLDIAARTNEATYCR